MLLKALEIVSNRKVESGDVARNCAGFGKSKGHDVILLGVYGQCSSCNAGHSSTAGRESSHREAALGDLTNIPKRTFSNWPSSASGAWHDPLGRAVRHSLRTRVGPAGFQSSRMAMAMAVGAN